jgi:hypothetical protein
MPISLNRDDLKNDEKDYDEYNQEYVRLPVRQPKPPNAYRVAAQAYNAAYPMGSDAHGNIRPKFTKAATQEIEAKKALLTKQGYFDVIAVSIESAIACGKKTVSKEAAVVALNAVSRCAASKAYPRADYGPRPGMSSFMNTIPYKSDGAAQQVTQKQADQFNRQRQAAGKPTVIYQSNQIKQPKAKAQSAPENRYAFAQAILTLKYLESNPDKVRQRLASFYDTNTATGISWQQAAKNRLSEIGATQPRTGKVVDDYNKLESTLNQINEIDRRSQRR